MYRLALLALMFCLMASTGGCANPSSTQASLRDRDARQVVAANPVEVMSVEQKRSEIDTSFPAEVPVAAGEVVRGEAQGADAWDYEVHVDSTPEAVINWYRAGYAGRGWQVTGHREMEDGGREITLEKGGAQSRVTVTPYGRGSKVEVILGVGAPVLETQ